MRSHKFAEAANSAGEDSKQCESQREEKEWEWQRGGESVTETWARDQRAEIWQ